MRSWWSSETTATNVASDALHYRQFSNTIQCSLFCVKVIEGGNKSMRKLNAVLQQKIN
jgi:hypothetical protein